MLLFVTSPARASEPEARALARAHAAAWPALAAARKHPRTGAPLVPAVTRLDLFLEAFAPAASPGPSGWCIEVPPADNYWRWAPALRGALRTLIRGAFPPGPRYTAPYDPCGPPTAAPLAPPSADGVPLAPLSSMTDAFRGGPDPAQAPVDPRLWLVLAPPLPPELETILLSTILRAEPFARIGRVPDAGAPDGWLAGEVDALIAGQNLATAGLVADVAGIFDLTSGLEDMYASREELAPGEVYNRFHSHTGSEELYIVLEGEGIVRVNERALPIRAGQAFGKPRGYDCSTQLLNTGAAPLVFLDVGTMRTSEVDLCRYPDHGELFAGHAGMRWLVPTDAFLPGAVLAPLYDRRYTRRTKG